MTTHSSILAWEIPRTEETGRLQSMGSQESDRLSDYTTTARIYKITEVACVGGSCHIPVKQYCFRLHILPLQSCRVCFIPTASFLLLEPLLLLPLTVRSLFNSFSVSSNFLSAFNTLGSVFSWIFIKSLRTQTHHRIHLSVSSFLSSPIACILGRHIPDYSVTLRSPCSEDCMFIYSGWVILLWVCKYFRDLWGSAPSVVHFQSLVLLIPSSHVLPITLSGWATSARTLAFMENLQHSAGSPLPLPASRPSFLCALLCGIQDLSSLTRD